jgi:hypothetical protein
VLLLGYEVDGRELVGRGRAGCGRGWNGPGRWRSARGIGTASPATVRWKECINAAIAESSTLATDGPLELQVAFTVGAKRNWRGLWKPAIDALDPILGRTQPHRQFHALDDRIVRLGLHRTIDPSLGMATAIEVHWRAARNVDVGRPRTRTRLAEGKPHPTVATRPARTRTPAQASAEIASGAAPDGITIFLDDDPGYERWLHEHATGYIVNAARNPKPGYLKVHRASCPFISSPSFQQGGWTTGAFLKACAVDQDALARWALREVDGRLDAGCRCR